MPLSEHHRRHIIELLEQGQDLPPDYKHLLFPPERQEYELVYADKEREEDILAETMAVPLQPVKTFGGNGEDGWHNMLIFGDNLQAMKTLLQWKAEGRLVNPDGSRGVKLVYIDPPFATKQEFRGSQDERAYQDKVAGARFVEYLRKRLILIRELLTDDGNLVVHLDPRKVHYVKVILDEVFGEHNFITEVIWHKGREGGSSRVHSIGSAIPTEDQNLLIYAKKRSTRYWQQILGPFKRSTVSNIQRDEKGWYYTRGRMGRKPAEWELEAGVALKTYVSDDLRKTKEEVIREITAPGADLVAVGDGWNSDLVSISQFTGYPTEKPESLLHLIIRAGTQPDDIVLDAFAGSGTTLAVAEKLGRRWIGIDCGKLDIYTIQKRMLTLREGIGNKGKPLRPRPFTLYNAGLYDFSQLKRGPWEEWRRFALLLFQCRDEPHPVGGVLLDGYRGADDVLVFNHLQHGGVVLDYGFIDDLHAQIGGKVGTRFFIIAPAASVTFLEDYIDKGRTRYYILRIPYSIINELHSRDFEAITQPVDESQVNATVEAVGFDFIRLPEVECDYPIKPSEGQLIDEAVIQIKTFKSRAMVKGATQKGNLETLSMVMVDYDYDGEVFALDTVVYAADIEKNGWEVRMPLESLGKQVMIISMDIYGNEYREVKTPADFGGSANA
ncbi:DNA methyltransferase [Roseiflexus castenholzii]|uniref:DNA methyltransferase n=1 Tax=Roseiflexus castenholzii TaxID=120962 RepID=UPI003C7D8CCA